MGYKEVNLREIKSITDNQIFYIDHSAIKDTMYTNKNGFKLLQPNKDGKIEL